MEFGLGARPVYLKLAWTFVSAIIATLQVSNEPEQEPVQLTNFRPGAGVAVKVTVEPCWNFAEQLLPQLMSVPNSPFGVPVTVPFPPRPIESV